MDRNVANVILNNYIKKQIDNQSAADIVRCLQTALLDLLETVEPSHCMRVLSKFEISKTAVPDHCSTQ
jgi:hypothetical protein